MSEAIVRPTIFREYIGVKPDANNTVPDFPGHIINDNIPEFHFILGFATEDHDQDGRGTGCFRSNWNANHFSPAHAKTLKERYDNVKVVISIGGRDPQYPFNPADSETWPDNAIRSLRDIIEGYKCKDVCSCHNIIDGIDINYQYIDPSVNIDEFAHYMGKVIVGLKDKVPAINVVSIAPSQSDVHSDHVPSCYKRLYEMYHAHINWVDYQFYCQPVPSPAEFVDLYNRLSEDFDPSRFHPSNKTKVLLAGGSTDPADAANMPREVFIEGVRDLVNSALLPGAFVWNANDSVAPIRANEDPFFLEKKIQAILTGSDDQ